MLNDRITVRFKDPRDLRKLKNLALIAGVKLNKLLNNICKTFIENETDKTEAKNTADQRQG